MSNNISGALQAYQQALGRIGRVNEETKIVAAPKAEGSFENMVKSAISETSQIVQQSEKMSIQGISGKADIQDVVLAVSNAEQALETLVTVRNTAVQAYQEIMRMTI
ncbi:MAG: flagellar hook-basal body complex protein FliE [Alphaproteobacteria bacterium]|nr:flagellar hook-basal body complex protein FliE [Alphaproteobacteria bacterium]